MQPHPTPNTHPPVLDAVIDLLRQRAAVGLKTYGTPLQPFNGRNAIDDAIAEAADLLMYLVQAKMELEK